METRKKKNIDMRSYRKGVLLGVLTGLALGLSFSSILFVSLNVIFRNHSENTLNNFRNTQNNSMQFGKMYYVNGVMKRDAPEAFQHLFTLHYEGKLIGMQSIEDVHVYLNDQSNPLKRGLYAYDEQLTNRQIFVETEKGGFYRLEVPDGFTPDHVKSQGTHLR